MNTKFPRPPLLSRRQQELCDVIERLAAKRGGIAPSVREVAVEMNLHPSRIAQLAATTAAKGRLVREPRVARAWRVVRPDAPAKPRKPRS